MNSIWKMNVKSIIPKSEKWKKGREAKSGGSKRVKVRAAAKEKPEICTADELHYVRLPNTNWRLALWRYLPPPNAITSRKRNHPLVLLSGVGTNALAFDLSPQFSFARNMSGQGFDTWILEVRGAGLSIRDFESSQGLSKSVEATNGLSQITVEDSIPLSFPQLSAQVAPMIEDFGRQLDLFLNSDWDFDQLLKEDLPLVVEYIRTQSNPSDGKLLGIGHSMGGILLYAMLSLCGFEGRDSNFAGVVTLASTLDYSTSKSSLKLLLPLADPAEALNIPSIPIGTLLAAMHPFAARPPFLLSWLNSQISAQDMMQPDLFDKLVLKNFCEQTFPHADFETYTPSISQNLPVYYFESFHSNCPISVLGKQSRPTYLTSNHIHSFHIFSYLSESHSLIYSH